MRRNMTLPKNPLLNPFDEMKAHYFMNPGIGFRRHYTNTAPKPLSWATLSLNPVWVNIEMQRL